MVIVLLFFRSLSVNFAINKKNSTMKVGTHDGIFHADDVFACAIIDKAHFNRTLRHVEIVRTRDSAILADCDIRVDVGGKFNVESNDFDHHHDRTLPASSTMAWLAFSKDIKYGDKPISSFVKDEVTKVLFDPISGIDCNLTQYIKEYPENGYLHISQIISGFNRIETGEAVQRMVFENAVEFAGNVLSNCIHQAAQKEVALEIIAGGEMLSRSVTLFHEGFAFNQFRDHVTIRNILVMPHLNGDWQVVSMDTGKFNLSECQAEGLKFTHKAGFFALFTDKNAARKYALSVEPN